MENPIDITFTKITPNIAFPETRFYFKIIWKNNAFDIEITSGNQQWFGSFSPEDLRSFSEELNETEEEYFCKTKTILSKQSHNYSYEITHKVFLWSKILFFAGSSNSTRKIIQGKIDLTLSNDNQSIDNLIDSLLDINGKINSENDFQKIQIKDLKKELEKSLKDNLELIQLKDKMESTLYSKFVEILNCKKKRIQFLEDEFVNRHDREFME